VLTVAVPVSAVYVMKDGLERCAINASVILDVLPALTGTATMERASVSLAGMENTAH